MVNVIDYTVNTMNINNFVLYSSVTCYDTGIFSIRGTTITQKVTDEYTLSPLLVYLSDNHFEHYSQYDPTIPLRFETVVIHAMFQAYINSD